MTNQYPALAKLLSPVLHEDWRYEHYKGFPLRLLPWSYNIFDLRKRYDPANSHHRKMLDTAVIDEAIIDLIEKNHSLATVVNEAKKILLLNEQGAMNIDTLRKLNIQYSFYDQDHIKFFFSYIANQCERLSQATQQEINNFCNNPERYHPAS